MRRESRSTGLMEAGTLDALERVVRTHGEASLTELDGVALVHNLRTYLLNHAEEQGYALRDLACPLNAAALLPDRQWFLQVEDGATVIQPGGQPPRVVFWPDNGEYANQTCFVTDVPDAHIHVAAPQEKIERVSLVTDGLQTLALSLRDRAPHAPFFEPMFRTVEALEELGTEAHTRLNRGLAAFLDSPAVNARTSDDKTLVLATRLNFGRLARNVGLLPGPQLGPTARACPG